MRSLHHQRIWLIQTWEKKTFWHRSQVNDWKVGKLGAPKMSSKLFWHLGFTAEWALTRSGGIPFLVICPTSSRSPRRGIPCPSSSSFRGCGCWMRKCWQLSDSPSGSPKMISGGKSEIRLGSANKGHRVSNQISAVGQIPIDPRRCPVCPKLLSTDLSHPSRSKYSDERRLLSSRTRTRAYRLSRQRSLSVKEAGSTWLGLGRNQGISFQGEARSYGRLNN